MEKSNAEQVLAARAHLTNELGSIYKGVRDNNPVGGLHGCHFVVTFSHVARLEHLVATFCDKGNELSDFFAADPNSLIRAICESVPAYVNAGEEQIGYAIRSELLNRIKDLAKVEGVGIGVLTPVFSAQEVCKGAQKGEVESSLHAATDPAVKAEFEQWYREEISTDPSDLEKWNNALYLSASTDQYFTGFIGGLGRRTAFAEAALAEQVQNVKPRLDALVSQVTAQLERSRQVLGSPKLEA